MMLATLLLLAGAQSIDGGTLELVCGGGGAANKIDTTTAYAGDSNGNAGWATINGRRSEAFEDQVDLTIDGDNSRIRLPRTMLPPVHGGENGWFKLKDLKIEPSAISGTAAVNFMNNPKIYLDRRTGRISIDGRAGHYSGDCERAPAAGQQNKF